MVVAFAWVSTLPLPGIALVQRIPRVDVVVAVVVVACRQGVARPLVRAMEFAVVAGQDFHHQFGRSLLRVVLRVPLQLVALTKLIFDRERQ